MYNESCNDSFQLKQSSAIRLILASRDAELEERNIKDLYTNIVLTGIHGESASTAVIIGENKPNAFIIFGENFFQRNQSS